MHEELARPCTEQKKADQGQVLYEMIQRRAADHNVRGHCAGIWATDWNTLERAAQDMWRHVADDFLQSTAPKGNP
jgi:hypothetical protein